MTNPAAPPLPLAEVTHRAIRVLSRELGPADAARFVGQFSGGSGDYTAERDGLFAGRTVAELEARRDRALIDVLKARTEVAAP